MHLSLSIYFLFYNFLAIFIRRRFPFSQIYLLKLEIEGQSLGLVTGKETNEVKEIVAGSVAADAGIPTKV